MCLPADAVFYILLHFSVVNILYKHYQTDSTSAEEQSPLLCCRNSALNISRASIYTSTTDVCMAETSCSTA